MKCYYAHPVSIYGTEQENRDVDAILRLCKGVLNPNHPIHDAEYKKTGIGYFDGLVENCDALAFRAFPDGSIPAGVGHEISVAIAAGIPVFELPTGVRRRRLGIDETREFLSESGAR